MERHVTALARALAARGNDVTVFSEMPLPRSNDYARQLRAAGIPVFAGGLVLPRETDEVPRGRIRDVLARGDYNRHTRGLFRNLEAACKTALPDVVHIHGCRLGQQWVAEWAAARDLPAVYTEHTTLGDWGGPHDADAPFAIWAAASVLTCVSEASRASLLRTLPAPREVGIARHIVPSAIGVRPEQCMALCVARLSPHKGIDVLLRALTILRREGTIVPLKIAGSGEAHSKLAALSKELGLSGQVQFLGQVAAERIAALWAGCTFGILPSRTEALPLSIIEAMSHGRAVIASNVGGIAELVRGGETGFLVAPDDPVALANAIRRCAGDPAFTAKLGAAARRAYENGGWSEPTVIAETLTTYAAARTHVRPRFPSAQLTTRWSPVYHVTYGLASLGDGEERIAELLLAQHAAGGEPVLILGRPISSGNRYGRLLRQSSVAVYAPGILRIPDVRRLLAAACRQRKPAIVHLHYWSTARDWAGRDAVRAYAAANDIPYCETDHAVAQPVPTPHDPYARLAWLNDGSRQRHMILESDSLYERSCNAVR